MRFHEPIIRIEVGAEEMERLFVLRKEVTEELKRLGFFYITMDLEGFRSGSMDIGRDGIKEE